MKQFGLGRSVALTLASAVLWGVAHLVVGLRRTGLALMGAYAIVLATVLIAVFGFGDRLLPLAVQPGWLTAMTVGLAVVAITWSAVIIWSFILVRPTSPTPVGQMLTIGLAASLCALIIAPSAYAARLAYLSHDVVTTLFSPSASAPVLAEDPWNGAKRVNILLIGADAAPNRPGVRTDSMTVASVDTATGAATLFGLPRNLENVPLPAGPARERFPSGFSGEGDYTPNLLNEVFQYAEDYPEMVPGVHKGKRGPTLLKSTVSGILGIPVEYYAMVDMKGFAEIIDAMGGVRVTIKEPITFGKYNEGYLAAGTRKLSGQEALWYGRSRTNSDDYVRMGRQKCLLNAVAKQADPITVLNSFEKLAGAAKRAISTDVPQSLLPALIDLSMKVKGTQIKSLQFVPPLISTVYPDWALIKQRVRVALAEKPATKTATTRQTSSTHGTSPDKPVSLDSTCG
ncbi:LCP family protein [Nonomuraea sp. NPDC050663]|uniref:LCP family protein n=1 Tax=Nonomuraea sp. NPDC050663 TaxID=3364370 RepID=UPI003792DB80